MEVDVKSAAATAERVVESFMKVEPIIMTVSSFVPGAAPVMALVHPAVIAAAPFIEQALHQLAAGNNGNALTAFLQLIQHLTSGQPNAAILAPAQAQDGLDSSRAGSG